MGYYSKVQQVLLVFGLIGPVMGCFGAACFLPQLVQDDKDGYADSVAIPHLNQQLEMEMQCNRSADLTIETFPPIKRHVRDVQALYPPMVQGGEDPDPDARWMRDTVRQMMKHAWDGYVAWAWGENELKPVGRRGFSAPIFGGSSTKFGATIVDSLGTLYIMGFYEEYRQGRNWVQHHLNFDGVNTEVSVFETNIRFIGGLLSCFALTGDAMFRDKALHIAQKILPAFDSPSGIPAGTVNLATGVSKSDSGMSYLAEFGTLSLEFNYLSNVTGIPVFREKIQRITDVMKRQNKPYGLYPTHFMPDFNRWGQEHISLGGRGDSFYEYLLKSWLQSGKTDEESRQMYVDAMEAATSKLIQKSKSGLTYLASMNGGRLEHTMEHLTCFAGGMLALGGMELGEPWKSRHMELGKAITNTCRESYNRTKTKLGPESFSFTDSVEAEALYIHERQYLLRPEVVESYFIMWRLTHDPRYRQWGWEVVQALEKYCRIPSGGYSGLSDVYRGDPLHDDVQQSFFLAETLKYLYLLFSHDDLISLDYWVFNTEAHPLPIKGVNPYYR